MYNTDELELITRNINKANKKTKFNKLYKFTVTTDKAQAYHEKCDDTNSTLLLLETVKGKNLEDLLLVYGLENVMIKRMKMPLYLI